MADFDLDAYVAARSIIAAQCTSILLDVLEEKKTNPKIKVGSIGN